MDRDTQTSSLLDYAIDELRSAQANRITQCKICGADSELFDVVDFNKACHEPPYMLGLSSIPVTYRMCRGCGFIFTDFFDRFSTDQWRRYVYNDEYIKIDPQYVDFRPRQIVGQLEAFLTGRKGSAIGLDYGGGNGKTTSLLRERGWAFDCYDPFGHIDLLPERAGRYNFCCAMEVFEHTPDPVRSLQAIVEMASPGPLVVMIGTLIHDRAVSNKTRLSWWYASPRNGHVSLYSRKSLETLARKFSLTYVAISDYPHILIRQGGSLQTRGQLLLGKVKQRFSRV